MDEYIKKSDADKIPAADVVSIETYKQVAWERDQAIQQLREDYGVGLGEKKADVALVRHGTYTTGDRIRAMSDEELANTIHAISLGWQGQTSWCDFHCENPGEDGCDKCILKWLQQPAED